MLLRRVAFPHFCEPCLRADKPPAGAGWLHEIKHDGFRMLVRRDARGVRLFTRNGHDWTGRFPLIARAALSLKIASCLIDGEAVACGCATGARPVSPRAKVKILSRFLDH